MATAPLTIDVQQRPPAKNERAARPRHVTQRMAARLIGVSEATLGRWTFELGFENFPAIGESWRLPQIIRGALFAALSTCPSAEKRRPAVVETFKFLWESLIADFDSGVRAIVFWSNGSGLALVDDRSMVRDVLLIAENPTASTWMMDPAIVIESTIHAYKSMLREHGIKDDGLEFASKSSSYWKKEEIVGTLIENGVETKEILR